MRNSKGTGDVVQDLGSRFRRDRIVPAIEEVKDKDNKDKKNNKGNKGKIKLKLEVAQETLRLLRWVLRPQQQNLTRGSRLCSAVAKDGPEYFRGSVEGQTITDAGHTRLTHSTETPLQTRRARRTTRTMRKMTEVIVLTYMDPQATLSRDGGGGDQVAAVRC